MTNEIMLKDSCLEVNYKLLWLIINEPAEWIQKCKRIVSIKTKGYEYMWFSDNGSLHTFIYVGYSRDSLLFPSPRFSTETLIECQI
jgi:hypothetical protein